MIKSQAPILTIYTQRTEFQLSFFSSIKTDTQIGVDFQPTGVAVVQVENTKKVAGKILRSVYLPSRGQQAQLESLRNWITKHSLQRASCVCLIADTDCDINQIEKPEVDDSELAQALTWRIKDLVSYEVDSAVVDVYPMPVSGKNNTQQVSVVSADEKTVAAYVQSIQSSGMKLLAIDIHDLVTGNLPVVRQGFKKAQAILSLGDSAGVLSIFNDTDLYLSRHFKIGLSQLGFASGEDQSIYDNLLLEVQRSMDYYESYYGLGSVSVMEIFPRTPVTEKMVLYLQNLISYDIDFVVTNNADSDQTPELDSRCFHAYCAALRGTH